jgi:hypothetical protein
MSAILDPKVQRLDWWRLPSGRIVCVRDITGPAGQRECEVRYVDEQGGMSTGSFRLTLAFLLRGRRV